MTSIQYYQQLSTDDTGDPCFLHGTPVGGEVYGRLSQAGETGIEWVTYSAEVLDRVVPDHEFSRPGRLDFTQLSADQRRVLQNAATQRDWRELAVDLHVKTPLTNREADVYVLRQWFALNRREIADQLDISPNTVDNHVQRVKEIDGEMIELVSNTIQYFDIAEEVAAEVSQVELTD
ncbi:helix-turn-helix transcriptional regulator [Halorussus salinus]|uniref:helix-turn-helix transcriptional regulator n=1 Tax=Halorussus salinus TaxID=1364935 RepID=UPI001091D0E5|nr:sigma factor-like helix-turn-helix DNA-binding protein [Halorussus salinus]